MSRADAVGTDRDASLTQTTGPSYFGSTLTAVCARDVVAPPMFAVVYSSPAVGPAIFDPEIGIDFALMVHGGQEFRWGPLVIAGDEITTTVKVTDISERAGRGFYVFETESVNQDGETVCVGTWTNIVRGQ